MRYLAFGDVHLHPTNEFSKVTAPGQSDLLNLQECALSWVAEQVGLHAPDVVVFLGDLAHSMGTLDVGVLNVAVRGGKLIEKVSSQVGAKVFAIVGNHDLHGIYHSFPFFPANIVTDWLVDSAGTLFLPYDGADDEEVYNLMGQCPLIFSHALIRDMEIVSGRREERGFDISTMGATVISGHYHTPGTFKIGNSTVHRPGSLVARTFSDARGSFERGIAIVDLDGSGQVDVEFIPNPHTEEYITFRGTSDSIHEQVESYTGDRERTRLRLYWEDEADAAWPVGFRSVSSFQLPPVSDEAPEDALSLDYGSLIRVYAPDADLAAEGHTLFNKVLSSNKLREAVHFSSVKIENFLSIEELRVNLSDPGVVLVTGENGAGKSAMFEAIVWCLYGATPREVSHDHVVRRNSDDGTEVSVSLTIDGVSVLVTRTRKRKGLGNALKVICDGEEVDHRIEKETQRYLNDLLGIDAGAFTSLVVLGQKTEFFSISTDANRRGLLHRVIGAEDFDKAREHARSELKAAKEAQTSFVIDRERLWAEIYQLEQLEADRVVRIEADREGLKMDLHRSKADQISSQGVLANLNQRDVDWAVYSGEASGKTQILGSIYSVLAQDKAVAKVRLEEVERVKITSSPNWDVDSSAVCRACGQTVPKWKEVEQLDEAQHTFDRAAEAADHYQGDIDVLDVLLSYVLLESELAQAALSEEDATWKSIREELNTLTQAMASRQTTIDSLTAQLSKIDEGSHLPQMEVKRAQVDERGFLWDRQDALVARLEFWVHGFGPKGVQALALPQIVKLLHERAEGYSVDHFGGYPAFKVFVENDQIQVTANGSIYKSLSLGERARVNMCLQFALYDLLVQSMGSVNFLVVDEVDLGLNDSGVESLFELLKASGRSVFLVSHNKVVQGLPATARMHVTKDPETEVSALDYRRM